MAKGDEVKTVIILEVGKAYTKGGMYYLPCKTAKCDLRLALPIPIARECSINNKAVLGLDTVTPFRPRPREDSGRH